MADLQQHKELEKKVHEQLYNNLYLLSRCYPTSTEFNRIFKKDMFIKNNKAAFHQVVYYLLYILNPQLTKEKLTSWPPYDIKLENKFRGEMLRYINELNNLYDDADIPPIMASQLISPGGFKFTKFIFKLSQLVMHEHLKKTNRHVLSTLKPGKNTSVTEAAKNSLKIQVASIESDTRIQLDKFNSLQKECKQKAISIVESSSILEQQIVEAKNKLLETKEDFNRKYHSYPSLNSLREKFLVLHKKWVSFQSIHELFAESEKLLLNLKGDNLVLVNEGDSREIDLIEMFHGIQLLLQESLLELPNPNSEFIDGKIEDLRKLNESFLQREKEILERKFQTETVMSNIQESLKFIGDLIHVQGKSNENATDDSDDMLDVKPLENS